ncbi:hypothetical protein TrVE_jg5096 [Triparma verrucosa]|uniref:Uncharacterized protein n=1 Tax=Triparma verrucosa TaxID=1606542 RepID=A0A9W7EKP8_9STRA|nr:hypothetical protein TrVE_jg5096 [Triparma verrucosa]
MPLQCHLVGGFFASIVQVILFVLSFSSLLLKRHYERPRRPMKVWILDTLKQGFSANLIHFWNILASVLMTRGSLELSDVSNMTTTASPNFGDDDSPFVVAKDECALYFITFFLDTTFGVLITFWLMNFTISLSRNHPKYIFESWSNPGDYSVDNSSSSAKFNNSNGANNSNRGFKEGSTSSQPTRVSIQKFGEQLFQWCIVTVAMKTIIGTIVFFSSAQLNSIGSIVMSPFSKISPKLELVFVMLVGPVCMNAFQFWVNDNILMRKERKGYVFVKDVSSDDDNNEATRCL